MNKYDVIVIGAGIIGTAICDELASRGIKVALLEKNPRIAQETTEGNSGVIHGGFDPTPGKMNAKLNLEGKKLYQEKWFKELNFPWKKIDSLVIAFNEKEKLEIKKLYQRGLINGLTSEELKIINKKEILNLEPYINPKIVSGLLCSSSYIVDPVLLTYALLSRAQKNKAQIFLNYKVINIKESNNEFFIICKTNDKNITLISKKIVNAAGHYADEIAKMFNKQSFKLEARRGQYCVLEKTEAKMLHNHIIFLVPTIYGKGVVIAPMLDGHVLVGPTAQENIAKEDTRLVDLSQVKTIQETGKKIIPKLNVERISTIMSGSRPIYQDTNDFIIEYDKKNSNFINVAGIKSPGLSAAPAIALKVANMIKK